MWIYTYIKRDMYVHKATTHVGNVATTSTFWKSGDATSTKLHEVLMLRLPYSYGVPPLHDSYGMPVPLSQRIANYVHRYNLSCVHIYMFIGRCDYKKQTLLCPSLSLCLYLYIYAYMYTMLQSMYGQWRPPPSQQNRNATCTKLQSVGMPPLHSW